MSKIIIKNVSDASDELALKLVGRSLTMDKDAIKRFTVNDAAVYFVYAIRNKASTRYVVAGCDETERKEGQPCKSNQ